RRRGEGATFAAIADDFGIAAGTVARRARREDWPTTAEPVEAAPTPADAAATPTTPTPTDELRRSLMRRLYGVMGLKLELMEFRMQKQMQQARKRGGEVPAAAE